MKYWVCENHAPGQSEVCVSLWDSKEHAQQAACADIMMAVAEWDLHYPGHEDMKCAAIEINDAIRIGNYTDAIKAYNEYQSNSDDFEYQDYFHIYEREVFTTPDQPTLISFDEEDENGNVLEEDTDDFAAKYNQPVASGSTCRGPCGSYNEYAESDRCDGTHLCHQCKMMATVFGG